MTITTTDTTDGKLSSQTLEHVRRNGGFQLQVPGPTVRHLRRGLHLALKLAADCLAEEAATMAETARNRYAVIPHSYTTALGHVDQVRAVFNRIGWDANAGTEPPADVPINSFSSPEFGVFYEAITLAANDDSQDDAADLGALLAAFDGCIKDAKDAHAEFESSRRAYQTF